MNLTDKMAYLRGMVDGMELDLTSTKEGKVLGQLLDVMQDLIAYVSDLQTQVDELTEVCDLFDQDLGDLEDIVYDEDESGTLTRLNVLEFDNLYHVAVQFKCDTVSEIAC